MDKEQLQQEAIKGMKEFDLAWEEFFKNKPHPKNEKEDKKQQEEFYNWYNFVRKQSDTGKTPAEMYKEIYGEEPKNVLNEKNPSRFMSFEWDENYSEDDFDEKNENNLDDKECNEITKIADEMFENGVWQNSKEQMKEMSRRDSSRHMFRLGFFMYYKYINYQAEHFKDKLKNMTSEEIKKMFEDEEENKKDEQ